jgi:hypothetical protein
MSLRFQALEAALEDLGVLLRHRLLPQPGGFEGFILARKGLDPHDPSRSVSSGDRASSTSSSLVRPFSRITATT